MYEVKTVCIILEWLLLLFFFESYFSSGGIKRRGINGGNMVHTKFLQLLDRVFPFLNNLKDLNLSYRMNPKGLNLSYKMDLDLWDYLERVQLVL